MKIFQSLVTFVNKHLTKINLEVTEIETQFHDGVYLTFLMGLLEGFFVPLHSFHSTPKDFEQKVHNVCFAFELMEEVGITKLKARPEGKKFLMFLYKKKINVSKYLQILLTKILNRRYAYFTRCLTGTNTCK